MLLSNTPRTPQVIYDESVQTDQGQPFTQGNVNCLSQAPHESSLCLDQGQDFFQIKLLAEPTISRYESRNGGNEKNTHIRTRRDGQLYPYDPEHTQCLSAFPVGWQGCYKCGGSTHPNKPDSSMINTLDRDVIKRFYRELYINCPKLENRPAYKEHIARLRTNEAYNGDRDRYNHDSARVRLFQWVSFYKPFYMSFYKSFCTSFYESICAPFYKSFCMSFFKLFYMSFCKSSYMSIYILFYFLSTRHVILLAILHIILPNI